MTSSDPTRPAQLPDGYTLHDTAPAVDDYLLLRRESGLSPKTAEQATAAISGSWAFRHIRSPNGQTVAMGRIIGDGGWYFVVADMATLPQHQGRGLGRTILDELLADVARLAQPGAYVTLTADPPGRRLYESRGFEDVAPGRTGMHLVM